MNEDNLGKKDRLILASQHLRSAIGLLDLAGAPGHIAAHVDLALNELEREVDGRSGRTVCKSLETFEADLKAFLNDNRAA